MLKFIQLTNFFQPHLAQSNLRLICKLTIKKLSYLYKKKLIPRIEIISQNRYWEIDMTKWSTK